MILPKIGIGPGIAPNFLAKHKNIKNGFVIFCLKVLNKLFYRSFLNRKYINSVANALKLGFRLLDYSSASATENLLARRL